MSDSKGKAIWGSFIQIVSNSVFISWTQTPYAAHVADWDYLFLCDLLKDSINTSYQRLLQRKYFSFLKGTQKVSNAGNNGI